MLEPTIRFAKFQFSSTNCVGPILKVRNNAVPKMKGYYTRKYAAQRVPLRLKGVKKY